MIWKYMSIDKFLAMLTKREYLYFPNIYSFSDRYEGTLSDKSLEEVYKTNLLNEKNTPIEIDDIFYDEIESLETLSEEPDVLAMHLKKQHSFETLLNVFSNHLMFCNCWFIRDDESHSMWAEYGDKILTSIAIQTTIEKLIESVKPTGFDIHIGKIKYKNYKTDEIEGYEGFSSENLTDPDHILKLFYAPIMHKRKIYKDEHEVRAIISFESICKHYLGRVYTSEIPFYSDKMFREDILYPGTQYNSNDMLEIPKDGIPVKTNLKTLIESVVIPPNAKGYFREALQKLIDNYGLSAKILNSEI